MNYVVYGEEQYQVRKQIDALIRKEVQERDDMNTITYDATQCSIDVILEDAQTIPFFTDKKVIVVQNANFLSASNDTDIDLDKLESYLETPMEETILILSGSFAKMDTRKKIVKKITSLCQVMVCNRLDKQTLPNYVREELKKRQIEMQPATFQYLCERLPFDIGTIQNELAKLELYGTAITMDVVKQLITRSLEEDAFTMVNAVVEKNIKKCFQIWEDMQVLNKDPIYLIALIASQFHLLYNVKVLTMKGIRDQGEIAQSLSVHPYRVKLAMPILQRLSAEQILSLLHKLATLDQNIKSGRIEKRIGFELFLLDMKGI